MRFFRYIILFIAGMLIASGCIVHRSPIQLANEMATREAKLAQTATVFQPAEATPTQTPSPKPRPTSTPIVEPAVWLEMYLPALLRQQLQFTAPVKQASSPQDAHLSVGVVHVDANSAQWIYAVVAPFPTVTDGITYQDLRRAWRGQPPEVFSSNPLMVSAQTRAVFEAIWGTAAGEGVMTVDEDQLLDLAWQQRPSWALLPFEHLDPRWKVLRVDGVSPLDKAFDAARYPLVARFGVTDADQVSKVIMPRTNRDAERMTGLVMSGVTALTRATGWQMEQQGMTFPGQYIWPWLREADITHVSNEAPFTPNCPPADRYQASLILCSRPEYIQLLEYIGADVVELTGNHLMNWGASALEFTMTLLEERGMKHYAAGENQLAARQPLLLQHNGNRIAFIGCNPVGPPGVWATPYRLGVADCLDYGWVKDTIRQQLDAGYIPIVTLQYHETYQLSPSPFAVRDFLPLSEAGAAIVSGSQAHHPHGLAFVDNRLVHFGLGNLFSDQVRMPFNAGPRLFNPDLLPVPGTRLAFIDRHIIYDGRHISTELLTIVLEENGQPRPMTEDERRILLQDTFTASGW